MAKTRSQKKDELQSLTEKVKSAKSMVFVNFDSLKVKDVEEFRKKCRAENVGYVVSKKTLMKLAFKEAGIADIDPKKFDKSVGTVLGLGDEVAPARIVAEFAKGHEAMATIGGVLEGKFVAREKVAELAKLPSKQQLLGMLLGQINAPVSGFVNVLAGNIRSLLYTFNAIKESKSN
ncbi:MAG: 50S ribosomal protein L10 [Candidatus Buchananbacteria bacterium]